MPICTPWPGEPEIVIPADLDVHIICDNYATHKTDWTADEILDSIAAFGHEVQTRDTSN